MRAIAQLCAIALSLTSFHLLSAQSTELLGPVSHEEPRLNVYPNPTYDLLTLKSDRPLDLVTIVDEKGERVMKIQRKQLAWKQIDVSELPLGFYKVQLFAGDEHKSFTVVKL